MTSEEITAIPPSHLSTNTWLREVCLQLARLNERQAPEPAAAPAKLMRKAS